MERLNDTPERQIMSRELFEHYVEGRKKAGGGEDVYNPDPKFSGFKVFNWKNPNFPYHFEDHYTDTPEIPGVFAGFEINRSVSEEGKSLTFYIYDGNLTDEGLQLSEQKGDELRGAEAVVFDRLIHFLGEHVEDVRFGKSVAFSHEDNLGRWTYEGRGKREDYRWEDGESISLNGVKMYELRGTGITKLQNT